MHERQPADSEIVEKLDWSQAEFDDHPQDECGVLAVYAPGEPVGRITYDGMQELQHRGQSGAGVAHDTADGRQLIVMRGNGLIDAAVPYTVPTRTDNMDAAFAPTMAIGHIRYSTSDSDSASQPFYGEGHAFALAHNGHIEDMTELAVKYGVDASLAASDSHLLTLILGNAATRNNQKMVNALREVLPQIDGAYSLTLTDGERVVGARDPWGFHPLALGKLESTQGYAIASEAAAFKVMGATFIRDIEPGEIVSIGQEGVVSTRIDRQELRRTCMFEYIYIARPDGVVDGAHVQLARESMGRHLANEHPVDADVVIGVPDSGMDAAQGYAQASGIPFAPRAIMKNQYTGRSFIEREGKREQTLLRKLRLSTPQIEGKRLVIVDDSLIKGKTMGVLVDMLRQAGAAEVHIRLAAPHYRYPCYMGMDTRQTWRLIARDRTDEEIAAYIGADSVGFNTSQNVELAVQEARKSIIKQPVGSLCTACATGKYPFKVPLELSSKRPTSA